LGILRSSTRGKGVTKKRKKKTKRNGGKKKPGGFRGHTTNASWDHFGEWRLTEKKKKGGMIQEEDKPYIAHGGGRTPGTPNEKLQEEGRLVL